MIRKKAFKRKADCLIIAVWVLGFLPLMVLSACAQNTSEEMKVPDILIVYLSRTENTKAVAGIIQEKLGGRLVELELETPYPEDYQAIVEQVNRENETGYLPPLKTRIDSLDQYELVFLGFPTWDMQLPPPMKSFLHQADLRDKTVIPFNTNGGYGVGSSFETVKQLCTGCRVLEGYSTKGGLERDGIYFVMEGDKQKEVQAEVEEWLQKSGLIPKDKMK